jgi:microsomal dipeptidase-like Zn-dependent dipeptidase
VDVATGSLGQGLPIGVGVALAGKHLDKLPYHVWVLLGDSEMAEGSIWEAFDHAGHLGLSNLIGIDHVSFGTDGLYGDHVGLHHVFSSSLSTKETSNQKAQYQEVDYVRGLENPTEASWNILRWLVSKGYGDKDIQKVIGGNALRVLRQVWK